MLNKLLCVAALVLAAGAAFAQEPRSVSGIYPHLAMFNNEGECGTGAVVPWAGKLWVVTYAPHMPKGSSDKLYEIAPDLTQTVRPESIGGTPANRMIHRESNQLFIGPYVIDGQGTVRTIPYSKMFGRPTGNARHLFDPVGKVYCASMEEGLYEIDVKTLEVTELWADEQLKAGRHSNLPGYHGKGLYSTGDRLIYANNGEHGAEALKRPDVRAECWPSGTAKRSSGRSFAVTSSPKSRTRRDPWSRQPQRSGLEHRLGPSLADPDVPRRQPASRREAVAPLPPAQGFAQLRWGPRLEHPNGPASARSAKMIF